MRLFNRIKHRALNDTAAVQGRVVSIDTSDRDTSHQLTVSTEDNTTRRIAFQAPEAPGKPGDDIRMLISPAGNVVRVVNYSTGMIHERGGLRRSHPLPEKKLLKERRNNRFANRLITLAPIISWWIIPTLVLARRGDYPYYRPLSAIAKTLLLGWLCLQLTLTYTLFGLVTQGAVPLADWQHRAVQSVSAFTWTNAAGEIRSITVSAPPSLSLAVVDSYFGALAFAASHTGELLFSNEEQRSIRQTTERYQALSPAQKIDRLGLDQQHGYQRALSLPLVIATLAGLFLLILERAAAKVYRDIDVTGAAIIAAWESQCEPHRRPVPKQGAMSLLQPQRAMAPPRLMEEDATDDEKEVVNA